mmetsp:Transcript_84639/g.187981  ORF Transcript_84639/g.187981 Transcript_84639/m.187981 type:complete len:220 (+) Transcript_84639:197-856(+)
MGNRNSYLPGATALVSSRMSTNLSTMLMSAQLPCWRFNPLLTLTTLDATSMACAKFSGKVISTAPREPAATAATTSKPMVTVLVWPASEDVHEIGVAKSESPEWIAWPAMLMAASCTSLSLLYTSKENTFGLGVLSGVNTFIVKACSPGAKVPFRSIDTEDVEFSHLPTIGKEIVAIAAGLQSIKYESGLRSSSRPPVSTVVLVRNPTANWDCPSDTAP